MILLNSLVKLLALVAMASIVSAGVSGYSAGGPRGGGRSGSGRRGTRRGGGSVVEAELVGFGILPNRLIDPVLVRSFDRSDSDEGADGYDYGLGFDGGFSAGNPGFDGGFSAGNPGFDGGFSGGVGFDAGAGFDSGHGGAGSMLASPEVHPSTQATLQATGCSAASEEALLSTARTPEALASAPETQEASASTLALATA
nr:keratin, type I cytoskeletal 9-like [Penaeus vannamei]